MPILLVAVIVASLLVPRPAAAAPLLPAMPESVRVNVAGLGTPIAQVGSTGSLAVRDAEGAVLYQGSAPVVARRDVYRLADGIALPDRRTPPADADERRSRLALLREARVAQAELGPRAIQLFPFELSVLRGPDPIGDVLLHRDRILGLRFRSDDGLLTYGGRSFRGTLELARDDEGDMILVNTVDTFSYLASVVGSEIPTSWHPEALAAQAVAARTYLLTHLKRHGAYDLEGDTRDQQYDGIAGETAGTIRAVQRTKGLVATYAGGAIEALYSANAGGVTEDSENVFPNALPYLRSVPSPWDKVAEASSWGRTSWSWTKEVTAPQLGDHMAKRGLDVGEVQSIELAEVSPSGRVLRAHVTGSKATRDVGKDRSRYHFGLLSSLFTVEKHAGGESETVSYLDGKRIVELQILGATRTATTFRVEHEPGDREHVRASLVSYVYELPARFVFTGRGFGHGVGMSQWGMQGMALAGASAEEILKHYYTGISLTDTGGS